MGVGDTVSHDIHRAGADDDDVNDNNTEGIDDHHDSQIVVWGWVTYSKSS